MILAEMIIGTRELIDKKRKIIETHLGYQKMLIIFIKYCICIIITKQLLKMLIKY